MCIHIFHLCSRYLNKTPSPVYNRFSNGNLLYHRFSIQSYIELPTLLLLLLFHTKGTCLRISNQRQVVLYLVLLENGNCGGPKMKAPREFRHLSPFFTLSLSKVDFSHSPTLPRCVFTSHFSVFTLHSFDHVLECIRSHFNV